MINWNSFKNENFLTKQYFDQIKISWYKYADTEKNISLKLYKEINKKILSNDTNPNINLNDELITKKFQLIDLNKDLTICFDDYCQYIVINLRFLAGDTTLAPKIQRLKSLITDDDLYNLQDIIKDIIFPLTQINPFLTSEKMTKINPIHFEVNNNDINKKGEIKITSATKKYEIFTSNINYLSNINNLMQILNSLSSIYINENFTAIKFFNDLLKCFKTLTNHYLVNSNIDTIIPILETLIKTQIFEKLYNFLYQFESNIKIFSAILKIFRTILSTLNKIKDISNIFIELNYSYQISNENIFDYFKENFIMKITSSLNKYQKYANNYSYINKVLKFSLEAAKINNEYLQYIFDNKDTNFLEIIYVNVNFLVNSGYFHPKGKIYDKGINSFLTQELVQKNNLTTDIETLMYGKESCRKYNITFSSITEINETKETKDFYLDEIKILFNICYKLSYYLFTLDLPEKPLKHFPELISNIRIKLNYILNISWDFIKETNDQKIVEFAFLIKNLIPLNNIFDEYKFSRIAYLKISETNNFLILYNVLMKFYLENFKEKKEFNKILSGDYLYFFEENLFTNYENFKLLNLEIFNEILELSEILTKKINKKTPKAHIFTINFQFFFEIFLRIFEEQENFIIFLTKENLSFNQISNFECAHLMKNRKITTQMFSLIIQEIEKILEFNEEVIPDFLKNNILFYLVKNLCLFLGDNFYYFSLIHDSEKFEDFSILRSFMKIVNILLNSIYIKNEIYYFIKIFNLDFVKMMKQIFDYFYDNENFSNEKKEIYFNFYKQQFPNSENFFNEICEICEKISYIYIKFIRKLEQNEQIIGENFNKISHFEENLTEKKTFCIKNFHFYYNNNEDISNTKEKLLSYFNILDELKKSEKFSIEKSQEIILDNYNFQEIADLLNTFMIEFNEKIKIFSKKNQEFHPLLNLLTEEQKNNLTNIELKNLKKLKNFKIILQNEEEKENGTFTEIDQDFIKEISAFEINQKIREKYSENFEIFSFNNKKNLWRKLLSDEDFNQIFFEEFSEIIDSTDEIFKKLLNFEINLFLRKKKTDEEKLNFLNICQNCNNRFKLSNKDYNNYKETGHNFYLLCVDCRNKNLNIFFDICNNFEKSECLSSLINMRNSQLNFTTPSNLSNFSEEKRYSSDNNKNLLNNLSSINNSNFNMNRNKETLGKIKNPTNFQLNNTTNSKQNSAIKNLDIEQIPPFKGFLPEEITINENNNNFTKKNFKEINEFKIPEAISSTPRNKNINESINFNDLSQKINYSNEKKNESIFMKNITNDNKINLTSEKNKNNLLNKSSENLPKFNGTYELLMKGNSQINQTFNAPDNLSKLEAFNYTFQQNKISNQNIVEDEK